MRGLDRLVRQLEALPNSVRAALDDALQIEAQAMVDAMKRAAPRKDGALQDSIDWCRGLPPPTSATGAFRIKEKDLGASSKALNAAGLLFSVFAGDDKAFYARWVEFGTSFRAAVAGKIHGGTWRTRSRKAKRAHHATRAHPFFFPTVRARKRPARAAIRKAARKAAKEIAALR